MNPLIGLAEEVAGMFFESVKPKAESEWRLCCTPFDGNEKNFVPPRVPGSDEVEKPKSDWQLCI